MKTAEDTLHAIFESIQKKAGESDLDYLTRAYNDRLNILTEWGKSIAEEQRKIFEKRFGSAIFYAEPKDTDVVYVRKSKVLNAPLPEILKDK